MNSFDAAQILGEALKGAYLGFLSVPAEDLGRAICQVSGQKKTEALASMLSGWSLEYVEWLKNVSD